MRFGSSRRTSEGLAGGPAADQGVRPTSAGFRPCSTGVSESIPALRVCGECERYTHEGVPTKDTSIVPELTSGMGPPPGLTSPAIQRYIEPSAKGASSPQERAEPTEQRR